MDQTFADGSEAATPILFVTKETWPEISARLAPQSRAFAEALGFEPIAGRHAVLPDADGRPAIVLFAIASDDAPRRDPFLPGRLASLVPAAMAYRFENQPGDGAHALALASLGWLLSCYQFTRYKQSDARFPRLVAPEGVDAVRLTRIAQAIALARDLINTPANDLGPSELEEAAVGLARRHGAKTNVLRGDALLAANFPLIHAVGRAAAQEPRLVDFTWGKAAAPKVTLVGKGVCFDSGGLDIKPSSAMGLMKKDMAGAATALALAQMIMDAQLPVRLRVILPIVENAISASAFRPGDIYPSRKGLSVEIGNTDAEGRLVLADSLALAEEGEPDLLFNFATLTGAARVALGPDLPPFYTHDDVLAAEILACGTSANDPVWRMPLWAPYDSLLDSNTSTLNNISSTPFAGSIVAALFLARFVAPARAWAHFDIYGWTPSTKPGRPEGGEPQTARLLYDLIETRYGGRRKGVGRPEGGEAHSRG